MSSDVIFVQIAAYRDLQISATLDSLLDMAATPDRLRICICWQHAPNDRLASRFRNLPNIQILDVDYRRSRGANWARRRVQKQWAGEPYSLVIDSHLRFVKDWDRTLIGLLHSLKTKRVSRPALTCYPPDFSPSTFPAKLSRVPLKIYKEAYHLGLLVHFAGHKLPLWRWLQEPIPAQFLALGLLFTEGRFNAEIPFDPNIYFFGDEITTGLRAYCHGYDLFHPHRVIAWHAYDRTTRRCHWQDHSEWHRYDTRSLRRVRRVFSGHEFKGYPLGVQRSISQYEQYVGLPLISSGANTDGQPC